MAYEAPAPADLILRYAAFTDVDTDVIQYWLTDAERFVDTSWIEGDYAPALMAHAAHMMTMEGLGVTAAADGSLPAGLTSFKSADLSASFSDSVASDRVTGEYAATRYGAEYARLRRRSRAGPRVASPGTVPADPRVFPMGET